METPDTLEKIIADMRRQGERGEAGRVAIYDPLGWADRIEALQPQPGRVEGMEDLIMEASGFLHFCDAHPAYYGSGPLADEFRAFERGLRAAIVRCKGATP